MTNIWITGLATGKRYHAEARLKKSMVSIVKNHFFSFLNFRLCQKSAGNFKGNFYFYLIGV